MKFYNWQFAPNCRRVRMFVLEKGLDLPSIEEVIGDDLRLVPDYLRTWPHAMVPMLELDDGTRIGEAMAICRFFEDEFPDPPLMGTNGREKGTIEMWERRAYDEAMIGTAEVFRNSHPQFADRGLPGTTEKVPQIADLIERGKGRVARFYHTFDDQLRDHRYVAGDRFSAADITTLCATDCARFNGLDIPADCPSVERWHAEISARPSAANSR